MASSKPGSEPSIRKFREMLESGKVKSYALEQEIFKEVLDWDKACELANLVRLALIESKTGSELKAIRAHNEAFCKPEARVVQIEQGIGSAIIPLGVAGPIKLKGEHARGEFFVTLATNESALVAGLNRGIKAANLSGGITTIVRHSCMSRAPVVQFSSLAAAKAAVQAIKNDSGLLGSLQTAVAEVSRHSKLLRVEPYMLNRYVWLRFVFDTSEAMGMNSVTKLSALLLKKLKSVLPGMTVVALSGNLCSDKKSSHINIINERGTGVEAEAVIPENVLQDAFGCSADQLVHINYIKNGLGSALSGTMGGFNANAANTVAAIYLATGQDAAQIVESSTAFVACEKQDDGSLKIGVSMPNIEVGTIGGGMGYHTAAECLKIMGCAGGKGGEAKAKLAEIVCASVLCQDLNLLGTLAKEFKLAESHIKLARGESLDAAGK